MKKNAMVYTNITICCIIALGFLAVSYINHTSNTQMLEDDISNISKLSSGNIYSKINSLLEKPIHISLTMANDIFLKKWLISEEKNANDPEYIQQLQEFLLAYKEKYNYDSVFLVSEKSKLYYHYNGIDRIVSPDAPENLWYYKFIDSKQDHALYVDIDTANHDTITVFVNCVVSSNETSPAVLGAVGVGLNTNYVQSLLHQYETEFNIKAYLIDAQGDLQVSSNTTKFSNINFFSNSYFVPLKEKILANHTTEETYKQSEDGIDTFYIIQYIPNLQWYLVVEKNTAEIMGNLKMQLYKKLCIIFVITLLVLFITTREIQSYHGIIVKLMSNDTLTGVRNRYSYELMLHKYSKTLNNDVRIAIAVFDLNGLKHINDTLGHPAGDAYIKTSAKLICLAFQHCPVFRIGGDEFAAIIEDADDDTVNTWHKDLLRLVAAYNAQNNTQISIAFGYAFCKAKEDNVLQQAFIQADSNMYVNKKEMKKKLNNYL